MPKDDGTLKHRMVRDESGHGTGVNDCLVPLECRIDSLADALLKIPPPVTISDRLHCSKVALFDLRDCYYLYSRSQLDADYAGGVDPVTGVASRMRFCTMGNAQSGAVAQRWAAVIAGIVEEHATRYCTHKATLALERAVTVAGACYDDFLLAAAPELAHEPEALTELYESVWRLLLDLCCQR